MLSGVYFGGIAEHLARGGVRGDGVTAREHVVGTEQSQAGLEVGEKIPALEKSVPLLLAQAAF